MSKRKPTKQDITVAAVEALLEKHGGRVSPRALLEEARDERSPFHSQFEWDDTEAGEQFRLAQAAQLIRQWKGSIMKIDAERKVVTIESTRRVQSPASQRSRGGESYETVEQLMADPEKRADMVQTVLRELNAYRKRYAQIAALSAVWSAIDEANELFGDVDGKRKPKDEEDRPAA